MFWVHLVQALGRAGRRTTCFRNPRAGCGTLPLFEFLSIRIKDTILKCFISQKNELGKKFQSNPPRSARDAGGMMHCPDCGHLRNFYRSSALLLKALIKIIC